MRIKTKAKKSKLLVAAEKLIPTEGFMRRARTRRSARVARNAAINGLTRGHGQNRGGGQ